MKYFILLLSIVSILNQSMASSYKDVDWEKFSAFHYNVKVVKNDRRKYIENLWENFEHSLVVNFSKEDKEKISQKLMNVLGKVQMYRQGKLIKVSLGDLEFLLSEFDYQTSSFKINGNTVKLNLVRGSLSQNVLAIMGGLKDSRHKTTWFSPIKESHALVGQILTGLGIFAMGTILVLAINEFYNQYRESKLNKLLSSCESREKSTLFENSEFATDLNDLLEDKFYRNIYQELSDTSCIIIIDRMVKSGSSENKYELDPVCLNLMKIKKCAERFLDESEKMKKSNDALRIKSRKGLPAANKDV